MALQVPVIYSASTKGSIWPSLGNSYMGMTLCLWVLLARILHRLKAATCLTQVRSGSCHCERAVSCSDKLSCGAWTLSVNSLRNLTFWFFDVLIIGLPGYMQKKMKSDSQKINGA